MAPSTDRTGSTSGHEPWITFYRLQGCPFCERVTRILDELGLPYRSRFVEPLHSKRDVVKRVAGVRTVPVIVDERTGVTMAESAAIVDYLEATYGEERSAAAGTPADAGADTKPTVDAADAGTDPAAETGDAGADGGGD